MTSINTRRHERARADVIAATAGLSQAQRDELLSQFEQGWRIAADSAAAQNKVTADICARARGLGDNTPTPPNRPTRQPLPMAA